MSQTSWQQAAEKYDDAKRQRQEATASDPTSSDEARFAHRSGVIARASTSLDDFLQSADGQSALNLLASSGQFIRFGEDREGGGFCTVYFIDGNGLHQSVEASGSWTAYSGNVPKPRFSPIGAHEAATAAFDDGKYEQPEEFVPWLRSELDKIAQKAPESSD